MGKIILRKTDHEAYTLDTSFKTFAYINYRKRIIKKLDVERVLDVIKSEGKVEPLPGSEIKEWDWLNS